MQLTTNYGFKKPEGNDNVNVDDLNYNMDIADTELKKANEQLGEKVKYTDLAPVTTTGTSSAYTATIPTNITEVTIIPHINNLAGATINGIDMLDREGKPIAKDTLKANIPTKLVRVGSNFFIASWGGTVNKSSRFKIVQPMYSMDNVNLGYASVIRAMNEDYIVYQNTKNNFYGIVFVVNRRTGELLYSRGGMDSLLGSLGDIKEPGIIVGDIFIGRFTSQSTSVTKCIKWNLKTNEVSELKFINTSTYKFIESKDGYIYAFGSSYYIAKLNSNGEILLEKKLGISEGFTGYLYDDYDYLYGYSNSTRTYTRYSKQTLDYIETVNLTGTNWLFMKNQFFIVDGVGYIIYQDYLSVFPIWNKGGNAPIYISGIRSIVGVGEDGIYVTKIRNESVCDVVKINIRDYSFDPIIYALNVETLNQDYVYSTKNTLAISYYLEYISGSKISRYGTYFEF